MFLAHFTRGADHTNDVSCPAGVTAAYSVADAAIHGTGVGHAFHVITTAPVVAYDIYPYGGAVSAVTSATLLLPTSVWDTNYVAASAYAGQIDVGNDPNYPNRFTDDSNIAFVGSEDHTTITVRPAAAIVGGPGVAASPKGTPARYVLNRGDSLQLEQFDDLSGSVVLSDKPIGMWGGHWGMSMPSTNALNIDSAHQQIPPVKALGSEYVAVRYRSRDKVTPESVPWRVVGAVDGTTLTFDPPQAGAPTTINARQLAEFNATGPFVISSQAADHPFYFAQYMTGGQLSFADPMDPRAGEGDPEYVNVISPTQFLQRYTFFTDPTYPETNLVVTRVKDPTLGIFPNVSLDCAGTLSGWAPVGSSGNYEFMRIDLSTGNFQGQNGCNNGVHTLTATLPGGGPTAKPRAGATVWGWGNPITYAPTDNEANPKFTRWVSYGYPVGANITPLNSVVLSAQ